LEFCPVETEIYTDMDCGSAVARGANIYAPGLIGSSKKFAAGEKVAAYAVRKMLKGWRQKFDGPKLFLGNGTVLRSRDELFAPPMEKMSEPIRGIVVDMTEPVWAQPALDPIVENWGFLQNFPSILTSHVLDPQPGETVLDMCAAPGGKSTHIACLMQDDGRVVCLDKGPGRSLKIMRNAIALGLKSVEVHPIYDATRACKEDGSALRDAPPFPPETFDRVILDPPCSSLGQRPLIKKPFRSKNEMESNEPTQRKLLATAVRLLKRGGILVYSTCTLREEENERQVEWALSKFPSLRLAPQKLYCGNVKVEIGGEDAEKAVQKFDPRIYCAKHENSAECLQDVIKLSDPPEPNSIFSSDYMKTPLSLAQDTIGFFIAKFLKA